MKIIYFSSGKLMSLLKNIGVKKETKPGPYPQFYLDQKPIGYQTSKGKIIFTERFLKKFAKNLGLN